MLPSDEDLVRVRSRIAELRALMARHGEEKAMLLELAGLTWRARRLELEISTRCTIVSSRNRKEINRFFHERDFRIKESGFSDKFGRPHYLELENLNRGQVAFYKAAGDANFIARRDIPIRVSYGDLVGTLVGLNYLKNLFAPTAKQNLDVPGVSLDGLVATRGEGQ